MLLLLGGEYVVIFGCLKVPLRAGFFTERQYFRSSTQEAPTSRGLTAGLGVLVGPVLLDGAYVYERGTYQDADSGDQATTTTKRFFLSLIYRHGSNN